MLHLAWTISLILMAVLRQSLLLMMTLVLLLMMFADMGRGMHTSIFLAGTRLGRFDNDGQLQQIQQQLFEVSFLCGVSSFFCV